MKKQKIPSDGEVLAELFRIASNYCVIATKASATGTGEPCNINFWFEEVRRQHDESKEPH